MFNFATSPVRKLAWSVALLGLALAAALVFSPDVRAAVLGVIKDIGGVAFKETDQYPGSGEVKRIPEQVVSLPEAQAVIPFALPTWVPDGLALREDVHVMLPTDASRLTIVQLEWCPVGGSNGCIQMAAERPVASSPEPSLLVGPGSVEEIEINGRSAALVRGGWNADTRQYDEGLQVSLMWRQDGITYTLMGMEDQVDDLIRMAESMP